MIKEFKEYGYIVLIGLIGGIIVVVLDIRYGFLA